MNGQHCENYDVKQETVHFYPRNVDRCCTWSERAIEGGLMLSQESQRVFQNLLLICFATNHLMTGPLGNSEFCFPQISMFPSTSSWETLRLSGNKIHCSPRDQSLSVYYLIRLQLLESIMRSVPKSHDTFSPRRTNQNEKWKNWFRGSCSPVVNSVYCLKTWGRFSKDPNTFRPHKAIGKTPTRLFCKVNLFICFKGNKN